MKYLKEYIDWEEDWEEEDDDIYSDYPEDFKEFLIENDALKKFHSNTLKYISTLKYDSSFKSFFAPFYIVPIKKGLISSAFEWNKTIEGGNYWKELSNKWRLMN